MDTTETPMSPPPAPSPQPGRADLGKRFVAALVDGLLTGAVSLVPLVGGIVGAAYILLRDGLELEFMDRRSIGKRLLGIRPVRLDGQPMDMATSVKRNLPFCIGAAGALFMVIPVLGWIVAILFGLVAMVAAVVEVVFVLTDDRGRRLGDKFAGTQVIDAGP